MTAVHGAGIADRVRWEVHRARIEEHHRTEGGYSCALIRAAASEFGRTERTIWRWLKKEPTRRRRFELTDLELGYIRFCGGDVRAAWDELQGKGLASVSYKTGLRAFRRLDPGVRLGIRRGRSAMAAGMPWLSLPRATRPGEVFEIDHALLADLLVRDPTSNYRGRPWLTIVIDVHSAMLVGFSVTLVRDGSANTESAFAAIADTLLGRDYDGIHIGGMPEWFRFDQGADFMSGVEGAITRLGGRSEPVAARTPQHKPYVERAIGTIKRQLLPRYPGYGRDADGRKSASADLSLLTPAELTVLLDSDIRMLNTRLHRGVMAVPVERYCAQPSAATWVEERHIGEALLRRNRTAIVRKTGVVVNGVTYHGPAAFGVIGETVGVGYLETHPEFIYIFAIDGTCLGRLGPIAEAGQALAEKTVEARKRQIEIFQRADRAADLLRADRLVQLRGGVVEGDEVPLGDRQRRRSRTDRERATERRLKHLKESGVLRDG